MYSQVRKYEKQNARSYRQKLTLNVSVLCGHACRVRACSGKLKGVCVDAKTSKTFGENCVLSHVFADVFGFSA